MAHKFNLTFRYTDDLLSIYNPHFRNYIQYIHPPELEIKETIISISEVSYLDLHLPLQNGNVTNKHYHKTNYFEMITFPYLIRSIPVASACGVYMSQLF